jgi:hypothetical protein
MIVPYAMPIAGSPPHQIIGIFKATNLVLQVTAVPGLDPCQMSAALSCLLLDEVICTWTRISSKMLTAVSRVRGLVSCS